jgi:hypothetical protein
MKLAHIFSQHYSPNKRKAMKKNKLLLLLMIASIWASSQVIEDFEVIPMNIMISGVNDQSQIVIVPNPDPSGINISPTVGMLYRDKDGYPWCGFWSLLPSPIDVTDNKYIHLKVWKPRISDVKFKIEGGGAGNLEISPMNPQMVIGEWVELVFDFSSKTGQYPIIALMPDYMNPVGLTEDIVIYFDDIMLNNDPTPGSDPAFVIENFEIISMNIMNAGPGDDSYITVVSNPDISGINQSMTVGMLYRDMDGLPWCGFWSVLPQPIDVTDNKYMHVKVWKPRLSPVKFKLEGGSAGTLEVYSMNSQDTLYAWQDMVFDFSSLTGNYPTIVFMPDYLDPVGLSDDIIIYFDDIILNNDSTPIAARQVDFHVDMRNVPLYEGEPVYISGTFGGIHGIWDMPGSNENNRMFDPDNDSIYSISMNLFDGTYYFKFFRNNGWAGGEWPGDPNRDITITSSGEVTCIWGIYGIVNVSAKEPATKISLFPNPFNDQIILNSTYELSRVTINSLTGQEVLRLENLPSGQTLIPTSMLKNGLYFLTTFNNSGEVTTLKIIKMQ